MELNKALSVKMKAKASIKIRKILEPKIKANMVYKIFCMIANTH